jgi:hypothetical protein
MRPAVGEQEYISCGRIAAEPSFVRRSYHLGGEVRHVPRWLLVIASILSIQPGCRTQRDPVLLMPAGADDPAAVVQALSRGMRVIPDTIDLRRAGHVRLIVRLPTDYGGSATAPRGLSVEAAPLARHTWERLAGGLAWSARDTVWLVLRHKQVPLNPFAGGRLRMLEQPFVPHVLRWRAQTSS